MCTDPRENRDMDVHIERERERDGLGLRRYWTDFVKLGLLGPLLELLFGCRLVALVLHVLVIMLIR